MSRKGSRRPVPGAPGIYVDDTGMSATVPRLGDIKQKEKRAPRHLDYDEKLTWLKRWQLRERAHRLERLPIAPVTIDSLADETLAASVPAFLATIPDSAPAKTDFVNLCAKWLETPLATVPRRAIRRQHILAQVATWLADGAAASTINHRVRTLRKLYDVLDDDDTGLNPCRRIPRQTEPEPAARGMSMAIIAAILAGMPDTGRPARGQPRPEGSKTKARLHVMAWTGLPHKLVKQICPQDIHWATGELDVAPRRKGAGVPTRRLPLLPEAVAALRVFDAYRAYGPFHNSTVYIAWQRAKARYLAHRRAAGAPAVELAELEACLPTLRPYDCRHSYAAMVYEDTGGNRYAVADLLMHANLKNSARYVKQAVNSVSRAALEAVTAARTRRGDRDGTVPSGAIRPDPTAAISRQKLLKFAERQKRENHETR